MNSIQFENYITNTRTYYDYKVDFKGPVYAQYLEEVGMDKMFEKLDYLIDIFYKYNLDKSDIFRIDGFKNLLNNNYINIVNNMKINNPYLREFVQYNIRYNQPDDKFKFISSFIKKKIVKLFENTNEPKDKVYESVNSVIFMNRETTKMFFTELIMLYYETLRKNGSFKLEKICDDFIPDIVEKYVKQYIILNNYVNFSNVPTTEEIIKYKNIVYMLLKYYIVFFRNLSVYFIYYFIEFYFMVFNSYKQQNDMFTTLLNQDRLFMFFTQIDISRRELILESFIDIMMITLKNLLIAFINDFYEQEKKKPVVNIEYLYKINQQYNNEYLQDLKKMNEKYNTNNNLSRDIKLLLKSYYSDLEKFFKDSRVDDLLKYPKLEDYVKVYNYFQNYDLDDLSDVLMENIGDKLTRESILYFYEINKNYNLSEYESEKLVDYYFQLFLEKENELRESEQFIINDISKLRNNILKRSLTPSTENNFKKLDKSSKNKLLSKISEYLLDNPLYNPEIKYSNYYTEGDYE